MNVTSSFPSKIFSSQVPDVTLTTDKTRVHVTITFGSLTVPIYEETLYPDNNGGIDIGELSELVTPFAREQLVATLTVSLLEQTVTTAEDGSETVTDNTTQVLSAGVVYCTALVSEDAATFCSQHFLSRLQGVKTTSLGRLEYLHFDSSEAATVTAYYSDGTVKEFTATKVGGNGNYSTIDVSPSRFVNGKKEPYLFVASAGSRTQTFKMDMHCPDASPVLLFVNSFGCQELIYCTGKHTVSPKFNYTSAFIGGKMTNYDIDEERNFKADTGVLTFPMADWLSDLFRSDEIFLVEFVNGSPVVGRQVVVTDQDSEYSNDDDELPRFTVTYRYAQRNQNVLSLDRPGRIFDNTFDYTFN